MPGGQSLLLAHAAHGVGAGEPSSFGSVQAQFAEPEQAQTPYWQNMIICSTVKVESEPVAQLGCSVIACIVCWKVSSQKQAQTALSCVADPDNEFCMVDWHPEESCPMACIRAFC